MVLVGPHPFTGPKEQTYLLKKLQEEQKTGQIQIIHSGKFTHHDLYPEAQKFHNSSDGLKTNEDYTADSLVACFNGNIGEFLKTFEEIFGTGYNTYGIDLHHHSIASNEHKSNIIENVSKKIFEMLSELFPVTVGVCTSPESYLSIKELINYTFFDGTDGKIEGNKITTIGTLSDHETISGVIEYKKLAEKKGFGEKIIYNYEENVWFPEMVVGGKRLKPAKVHILVPTLTKQEFEEIKTLKRNIFQFVAYAQKNNIPLVLAHGLFNMENLMTQHVKMFPLLFRNFEINLERPAGDNIKLIELAHRTDKKYIEKYMNEYDKYFQGNKFVHPYGLNFMTAGSDDHSGLMKRYTRHASLIFGDSKDNIDIAVRNALLGKNGFPLANLGVGMNRGIIDLWTNAFMVTLQHLRYKGIDLPIKIKKMLHDISPDHCKIFKLTKKDKVDEYTQASREMLNKYLGLDTSKGLWDLSAKGLGNLTGFIENFLSLDIIDSETKKRLKKNPEFQTIYKDVVQKAKLFEKGEIERDEYTKAIYDLFGLFTNSLTEDFTNDINNINIKGLMNSSKLLITMLQVFIEYTIQALYSNRHINKGLKHEGLIETPSRPQKTVLYVTDIDGTHGVAKSVLDFVKSKKRKTNLHIISVVRDRESFLKSDVYKILKQSLGEENFDVYQSAGEIKTSNGNNGEKKDFPILFPPMFELARRLSELKPTSAIDFTQDTCGLSFERFCDSLNIPVITVKDTDVGKYIEKRFGIKNSIIGRTYDAINELFFYRGDNRYLCAPSKLYLKNDTIIDEKKKFVLQRYVDTDSFFVEKQKIDNRYLQEQMKNSEVGLENPFEQYKDKEIINVGFVGRVSKEKNIRENLRHMIKHYYKQLNPGKAVPENRSFDDIKGFFGNKIPIFHIVGEGEDFDKFVSWAKKRKIPVAIYKEIKDDTKLRKLYNGFSIFYFPSKTDTFGRVIIEGQACGNVPIMYNDGGPSSIIGDTNSGIVATSDDDFFDKFKELVENPEVVKEIRGKALSNVAENFTEEAIIGQFDSMIESVESDYNKKLLEQENANGGKAMQLLDGN